MSQKTKVWFAWMPSAVSTVALEAINRVGRFATSVEVELDKRRSGGPFVCPNCDFSGHFAGAMSTVRRPYAICPNCGARERHRLQMLVLNLLFEHHDFSKLSLLHMAPESAIEGHLRRASGEYVSADINPVGVDLQIDLTNIDLPEKRFDVVYASHVLEHIPDDGAAIKEIARVLRPGGFAVLPVPIVGTTTVEYPKPVASEEFHVRGPGLDYYNRYDAHFSRTELFSSTDFDEKYQTWVYEDRSNYPSILCPYRQPSLGARHVDIVPVAYL